MKESDIERKLKGLPLRKMRPELREKILGQAKSEARPFPAPAGNIVFATNLAMIFVILILAPAIHLFSPPLTVNTIARTPDRVILETGAEIYLGTSLSFRAYASKTGGLNLIKRSEVQL